MEAYEPSLAVEEYAKLGGVLLGALAFIILIGLDQRNAIKNGAHWVPGRALILGALTVQIMNFVENQSGLLDEIVRDSRSLDNEIVKNNLFIIHTTRAMVCVLVALFLPGMARPGSEEKWTKIVAIGLAVFLDIFSEFSSVHNRSPSVLNQSSVVSHFFYSWPGDQPASQHSFFISGAIISISLIWLILLLFSAALAGKSIRNITTQKIPIILSQPAEDSWKGVEDQVLKSWIVARSCYPESIVARSALASSAALGVTICILSLIVGWIVQGPKVKFDHRNPASWLKFIIAILEVIFIVIGWAVIGWRWLTSVAYYESRRHQKQHWSHVEDYWTRHIVDLQEAEALKLRELKVDERISKMFVMKLRKLHVHERVSKMIVKERKRRTSFVSLWLKFSFLLQYYVVFFSKVCWFLSHLIVSTVLLRQLKKVNDVYEESREILSNMECMLSDEIIRDVVLKSIKEGNGIMRKGNNGGITCPTLIPLLKERGGKRRSGIRLLHPGTAHDETGLKFLRKRDPDSGLDIERYLIYSRKRSWKLTALTLINIIFLLGEISCDRNRCSYEPRDYFQAYYEAWEIMHFVEESDPETDILLSTAADRQFIALLELSAQSDKTAYLAPSTMETAMQAIKGLVEESVKEAMEVQTNDNWQDNPVNWEKLGSAITLSKVWKTVKDCSPGDLPELMEELHNTLADTIGACIEKAGTALLDSCRKWVGEMEEKKLLEAVYIAGKSKGLMKQLGWGPNVASTTNAPTMLFEQSSMV